MATEHRSAASELDDLRDACDSALGFLVREHGFGRRAELRRALGDDPSKPCYIETVSGQGYRFVGSADTNRWGGNWPPHSSP